MLLEQHTELFVRHCILKYLQMVIVLKLYRNYNYVILQRNYRTIKMLSVLKKFTQQISGVLLLTLFFGYFVGITFFTHKHLVSGSIIVHSHPFSSTEHHSHSCKVLSLLLHISHFVAKILSAAILIVALLKLYHVISGLYLVSGNGSLVPAFNFLRPPPLHFTIAEVN